MVIAHKLPYTGEVFRGIKQWRAAASSAAASWFWAKHKQEFWI